jgi:hypothetical protein
MDGVGAAGSATAYARGDHVHPSDTSKLSDAPSDGNTYGRKNGAWAAAGGGAIFIQDTAPTGAAAGTLWWKSSTGQLFIYYNDGTSTQWVMAAASTASLPVLRGHLFGCTLSTPGSSSSYSVAAGQCADGVGLDYLTVPAMSKTTGAWAVGSGNGGLDTGAIAINTWYHTHAIKRPDTGVVESAISLSPSAPTLGANIPAAYSLSRRIGSLYLNSSSQWRYFHQNGDEVLWDTASGDVGVTNPGTAAVLYSLLVPTGIQVNALIGVISQITAAMDGRGVINSPDAAAQTPTSANMNFGGINTGMASGTLDWINFANVRTNTLGQVRAQVLGSGAGSFFGITTHGYIDRRGRDA